MNKFVVEALDPSSGEVVSSWLNVRRTAVA